MVDNVLCGSSKRANQGESECVGFPHVSGVLRYIHTTIIFLMLIIFTFAVYAGAGDCSNLYGSPAKVYDGLTAASELVPEAIHTICEDQTQQEADAETGHEILEYYQRGASR